jgi:hypothetical protein
MTFDDGILKIYTLENTAEPGRMPDEKLVLASEHYFGYETVYDRRYYTALQANVKIENLVHIMQDREILALQIVVDEAGRQFRIAQLQHGRNKDGTEVTWLSLERLVESYEFKS